MFRHTPLFFQPSGLLQTLRKNAAASTQKKDEHSDQPNTFATAQTSSKYFTATTATSSSPLPTTKSTSSTNSNGVTVNFSSHIIVNPCQVSNSKVRIEKLERKSTT